MTKPRAKVLVIDNYDSFVYNLVQYLEELGAETLVIRNDCFSNDEVIKEIKEKIKPSHILISPGPGRPESAGVSKIIVKELAGQIPILGVCLGHQSIGEVFGAAITQAPELVHGKTSKIHHSSHHPLFAGIPNTFTATRYHSLIVDYLSLSKSSDLIIEAKTDDNLVMAISHRKYPSLVGVQYHPESILSEHGYKLLDNFLKLNTEF